MFIFKYIKFIHKISLSRNWCLSHSLMTCRWKMYGCRSFLSVEKFIEKHYIFMALGFISFVDQVTWAWMKTGRFPVRHASRAAKSRSHWHRLSVEEEQYSFSISLSPAVPPPFCKFSVFRSTLLISYNLPLCPSITCLLDSVYFTVMFFCSWISLRVSTSCGKRLHLYFHQAFVNFWGKVSFAKLLIHFAAHP